MLELCSCTNLSCNSVLRYEDAAFLCYNCRHICARQNCYSNVYSKYPCVCICGQLCTVRRARMTCSCMFAAISISIAPYHLLWIYHYPAPYEVCAVMREHEDAFTAFYLTESFLYRIVPVFAISTLNVFIIVRLWRITRDRKRLLAATSRSTVAVTPTVMTKNNTHKSTSVLEMRGLRTVNGMYRHHSINLFSITRFIDSFTLPVFFTEIIDIYFCFSFFFILFFVSGYVC